jgi:cytochrome c oxidase cbb3-type subunit 2
MTLRGVGRGLLVALVAAVVLAGGRERPPASLAASDVERGREVYEVNCTVCHGAQGDGDGRVAGQFRRRPQSLRVGRFKFRSTASGSLPRDEDLYRTVTHGIPRTGMLPHDHLDEADRRAVVAFIKTLLPRFQVEQPGPVISPSAAPSRTPELLARGRSLYVTAGCAECHGEGGKGDGPATPDLKDEWGQAMLPSDLNLVRLPRRSGSAPADLYRTIATGLDGTPMPSYADALTGEEIWAIVAFLDALPRETGWAGLPESSGVDLVRWHCTVCHNLDGPNLPRLDRAGWAHTVDLMIRWGAPIRIQERESVVQYLVENFGATRAP